MHKQILLNNARKQTPSFATLSLRRGQGEVITAEIVLNEKLALCIFDLEKHHCNGVKGEI